MTNLNNEDKSFKDKILAEMEEASRLREARRQELIAQEEQARREAEEAARQLEEARQEAERQAQLEAERQAQLEAESARRQAELEELARQEEEARLRAEAEAARLEEERRQAEERARQEEETRRREAEEKARREEEARQAELERQRAEETARLEAERLEAETEARRQEAERQREEAERQAAELARRQEELEKARQEELARIEAEERELARLQAARDRHLAELARLEEEKAKLSVPVATGLVTESGDLEHTDPLFDETLSETAIPAYPVADEVEFETENFASEMELSDQEGFNTEALLDEEVVYTPAEKRQENNKLALKISLILGTIILLMLLATGFLGYRYVSNSIKPLDANATEFVQVEIPSGSGNKLIGQILEDNGVIKNASIFNYYTKFKNYTNFQSGYYNFQKSMSLDEISKLLQEGGTPEPVQPALGKIVIPEGYTLTQIAKAVAVNADTKGASPFTEEEFLAVVQDEAFIETMIAKYPLLLSSLPVYGSVNYRLEGYLFPATYSYYEDSTVEDIVEQMLVAMDANLAVHYDTIASRGMTVNDILTLASLVEKEGATDGDRKQIASVFYNRLSIDMPLQSNIAILYAQGQLGEKTTLLEDATIDTSIDSPYNIYLNTGLMPGPVDNPGLSAITATIEPDDTDYLYFVADVTTGVVYYAETFEEHNANVETYVNSNL